MLRTDTGNFNRLLTSLGVGLVLSALVIPYFFFRDTDVLLIPQKQLLGLTHTGREAIEDRQEVIAHLEVWVGVLVVLLLIAGISLLVVGARRLLVIQEKEDERLEIGTKREGAELEQLNPEELEKKRDREAKEVTADKADTELPKQTDVPRRPPQEPVSPAEPALEPTPPPAIRPPQATPDQRYRQNRQAIVRIEESLVRSLKPRKFAAYKYLADVKVVEGKKRRQINIDGVFRATKADNPDILLELKITPAGGGALRMRIRQYTDALLATVSRYEVMTSRKAIGWLLLVKPEDFELREFEPKRIEQLLMDDLRDLGRWTIIEEAEIEEVPELFEKLFG